MKNYLFYIFFIKSNTLKCATSGLYDTLNHLNDCPAQTNAFKQPLGKTSVLTELLYVAKLIILKRC